MDSTVRFQHFEVLRHEDGSLFELGRGAMGITYKAFDTNLKCNVALKVINSTFLGSEVARQRFLREARAAAALRHPNVATVFHLGTDEDACFYAMEFVDGETVEDFMKREGAVPAKLALEIASQVCRALMAAEKQGLVHRDIKPANLMLVREEEGELLVKVIDFGLAKSTSQGEDMPTLTVGGFLGTPHFASPEQLEEKDLDVRSDIYSLGATLWYMLAGRTPFSGSLAQVMSKHLHQPPPFESLTGQPSGVIDLLRRMMAKDPAERPQTAAELRKAIEDCMANPGTIIAPQAPAKAEELEPLAPTVDESLETAVLFEEEPIVALEIKPGITLAERYRLVAEMEPSEMGRVFQAEAIEEQTRVIILFLHPEFLSSSQRVTQLEEQIEALAKLKAPALRKISSLENVGGCCFLAIEAVEGPSLLNVLRSQRTLQAAEAVRVLRPLAEACDALCSAGLPCPHLVPHEIILEGGQSAPVGTWAQVNPKFLPLALDQPGQDAPGATLVASPFSLLKESGAFAGKPASAFVYGIASLAYEMLGGVKGGSTSTFVPVPGLSEAGNAALKKALNPATSFESASAFVAEIASDAPAYTAPMGTVATPAAAKIDVTEAPPLPVPVKKSPLVPIIAGVAVLLAGAGGAFVFLSGKSEKSSPAAEATPTPQPTVAAATPTPSPTPDGNAKEKAQQLIAQADMVAGSQPETAIGHLLQAATLFPADTKPVTDRLETIIGEAGTANKALPQDLLEKAAELQVSSAYLALGQKLKTSLPDAACEYFRKAAEAGNEEGRFEYAVCLLNGQGTVKDDVKGIELLRQSAAQKNPEALDLLGENTRRGRPAAGLKPDPQAAFQLFSESKELGFLDAQANMGVMILQGQGTGKPANPAEAVALFEDGAKKGNPSCMFNYALSLEEGIADEADPVRARIWYIKSAQGGDRRALKWCHEQNIDPTTTNAEAPAPTPAPSPAAESSPAASAPTITPGNP